jgi:NADPH2:quinone reductase
MRVLGTVSSPEKADFARRMGADALIDYRSENIIERTLALTDGRGVDLILDHIGGAQFTDYFEALAPWGTIVSYHARHGTPATNLFDDLRANSTKAAAVRTFSMHLYDNDDAGRRRIMDRVLALFAEGAIRPPIGVRLPMARAGEAQTMVESGNALGRVILEP